MKTLSLFEEYTENNEVLPKTELANPWALDSNGNPILPENAERHGNYTYPKCHEPLNVRKRGKGEHSRRDHFYHKVDTACKGYSPHETESYIHKVAKTGIFKILQSCIENNQQFTVSWSCPTCNKQFNGNLLHHAKSVLIEKQFADNAEGQDHKQPDVSLVDENGQLIVAIEIVYTHDIEPDTWEFYNANNVAVIRLVFDSIEILNDIEQKLHNPDSVNVCLNITCKECQSMHQPRRLTLHKNKMGHYFFIVNIHNPFDNIAIKGAPFNNDEIIQANSIVKQKSQLYSIEVHYNERGFHFAFIVKHRQVIRPITRRNNPLNHSYFGTRKPSRGKYKSKSKSTSKSKPKSYSSYGKRSSMSNRSVGKRRK